MRQVHRPDEPELALAAVEAAERWTAAPTDDNRRAAFAAAEAADFGTPRRLCGGGGLLVGRQHGPAEPASRPPAEHLMPGAAANAVQLPPSCMIR